MYNKKIKEDLIPIIINKFKSEEKIMSKFVEKILNPKLTNDADDDEPVYCCSNCRMQVEVADGVTGYCEHCESVVFVERV
jgi:DNA-directed RNA polymerase subunit RPC12/RpoP